MAFRNLLLVATLLTASVAPLALADSATTSATVRNSRPSVEGSEGPHDEIVPSAGADTLVPVRIRVTDSNGHSDLDVRVTVYRAEDDEDDWEKHRDEVAVPGTPVSGSSTTADFLHSISMKFFDPPGRYKAVFAVKDRSGLSAPDVSVEFDYAPLVALSLVEDALDFGALDAGQVSAKRTTTIQNAGNVPINALATGTDLTGPAGTIPRSALRADGEALSAAGLLLEIELDPGYSSTAKVDWVLHTPDVPSGVYSGQLTLAAIEED